MLPQDTPTMQEPAVNTAKQTRSLTLFACVIIPLYTLLFAAKGGLLASNLSKTGNLPGNYWGFVLWGVTCAVFFYRFLSSLFTQLQCKRKCIRSFFQTACVMLAACALCPFLPEKYPVLASLHSCTGYLAMLLTLASTLLLSLELRQVDEMLSKKAIRAWVGNFLFCAALAICTGISGLTEAMFIITTSYHLFRIMLWLAPYTASDTGLDRRLAA